MSSLWRQIPADRLEMTDDWVVLDRYFTLVSSQPMCLERRPDVMKKCHEN